jgi:hypothetical protein
LLHSRRTFRRSAGWTDNGAEPGLFFKRFFEGKVVKGGKRAKTPIKPGFLGSKKNRKKVKINLAQ